MRFRIIATTVLALLVLALGAEPAAAAKPVTYEYTIQARMTVSIDGKWVPFTGTMFVSSRIVGNGAQTRHRTTYKFDLVSEDGTIRASGSVHRDVRTGPKKASQDHFIYRMNFIQAGRGVVAQMRFHTHYVFNAKGELVALHATYSQ